MYEMNKYILFCIVTSISFLLLKLPINPSLSASTLLYCIATGVCAYFVTAHYAPKSKTSKLEQHLQDIKQEVKETKKILEQEKTLQNKNIDISIISSTHNNESYIIKPNKPDISTSTLNRLIDTLKKNGHPVKLLRPVNPLTERISVPKEKDSASKTYENNNISIQFPHNLVNYN